MSFNLTLSKLNGHPWLNAVQWHEEIDSTNLAARQFAVQRPELLPALFVADRQRQGRGRGNHVWWSPSGCLMMTLAVSSSQLPDQRNQWGQLALLSGVAAAEAIERVCPALQIKLKWPNDLFVSGRKAGGILIESFAPAPPSHIFLIGIGINVSVNWSEAPPELSGRATCLTTASTAQVSRDQLLIELVDSFAGSLQNWREKQLAWYERWQSRCLLSGRIVTIRLPVSSESSGGSSFPDGLVTGCCEGVASDGQLLVRVDSGKVVPINVGEVVKYS